jgi:hypothetical protein
MKPIRHIVATIVACFAILFCSACTSTLESRSVPPADEGYVSITTASGPFAITSADNGLRTGTAEARSILGIISFGDATSATASKNGNIDIIKEASVNILKVRIYGIPIFNKYTTIVTGK